MSETEFQEAVLSRLDRMDERFEQMENSFEEKVALTESKLINMICVSRKNTVTDMQNMERRIDKKMDAMKEEILAAISANGVHPEGPEFDNK